MRQRIGKRRHLATIQRHNGNLDTAGNPTYSVAADWVTVSEGWYCELESVTGGENVRGRQTSPNSTHRLYGEYSGAQDAQPEHRVVIRGQVYNVVSAFDPAGDEMEMWIETRRQF